MDNIIPWEEFPLKAYIVWNVERQQWHRPRSRTCVLLPGVWTNPDTILKEVHLYSYRIIDIDFSTQIPADILRVLAISENSQEKKNLAIVKLRQLIEVHVFQNGELMSQLRKEPHALGAGIQSGDNPDNHSSTTRIDLATTIEES